ncbi:MAG TPA: hypothetical protein VGL72_32040 [Bryobacteraceae bacterium]|jgi:hypothetical protein
MRWILGFFAAVTAFAATPILRSTFGDNTGAWTALGGNGTVRVANEVADTRDGKPSLAFDYVIGSKRFGAAILPVEPAVLTGMEQLHFWIRTDYPTTVAVILSEKGGGNYTAMMWSPGAVWQEVKVEPRDFTLGERPNDPPDPDGKLDVDQLRGIGLADLGQLFGAALPDTRLPVALSRNPGNHTLLVSDFEVLNGIAESKDSLLVDKFDAPQISWLNPSGAALRLDASGDHAPGPALEMTYDDAGGAVVYIARNLPPAIAANVTHISFDIASEKPAQFVFTLQEKGSGKGEGPRYHTTVEVRGGGRTDHRDLALRAFVLDENGPPDPAGSLNIVNAKSLGIGDISATVSAAHGPNKIWISNLHLIARD